MTVSMEKLKNNSSRRMPPLLPDIENFFGCKSAARNNTEVDAESILPGVSWLQSDPGMAWTQQLFYDS